MMRWILLATTFAALALTFFGSSPGWMTLGIGVALLGGLMTVLAFAHAHIEAGARSEELNSFEIEELRKSTGRHEAPDDPPPDVRTQGPGPAA